MPSREMASAAGVLTALRGYRLPFDRRRGVRRDDAQKKLGMCLGYVMDYAKGWTASTYTMARPELSQLPVRQGEIPDFRFSSIQVNQGGSALHVDTMNHGPSLSVALGEHVGGDLWQFPDTRLTNRIQVCNGRLLFRTKASATPRSFST